MWNGMDYLLSRKHYYEISELTALIHTLLTLFAFTLKVMMSYVKKWGEDCGEWDWRGLLEILEQKIIFRKHEKVIKNFNHSFSWKFS